MSATFSTNVDYRRLAENITLLWMLDKEPGKAKENLVQERRFTIECHERSRQLTFKRERDLVDHLAFLSAFRDDADKVIAICVEEHRNPEGLTIRIAMNTGDLEPVKERLARIVALLEQVAARMSKAHEDESALFNEVIDLNHGRILSRLRSRHAKWSRRARDKPSVVTRLAKVVSVASSLKETECTLNNRKVDLKEVKERTRKLEKRFQQLEAMPADSVNSVDARKLLSELLTTAYELSLRDDLEVLGEAIPSSGLFSPGTGSVLRTALGKLGRYYSASRFLCAAARKLTVFKNIRVEGVSQLVQAANPLQIRQDEVSITTILHRIFQKSSKEVKRAAGTFQLNSGVSLASAEAELRGHLASSCPRRKIHAEIQLIFHYELEPKCPQPRIICSSKSSCFLCNLFIRIHGAFYIARTHGVLYHAWTLPDPGILPFSKVGRGSEVAKSVKRLNLALEDTLSLTLKQKRTRRCHPNESAFIEPAIWTPSVQSLTTNLRLQASGTASTITASCKNQLNSSYFIHSSHNSGSQAKLDVASTEENVPIKENTQSSPAPSPETKALQNATALSASTSRTPRDCPDLTNTVGVSCKNAPQVDLEIPSAECIGATKESRSSTNQMSPMLLSRTVSISSPPAFSREPGTLSTSLCDVIDGSIHQLSTLFPEAATIKYEPLIQGRPIWRELAVASSPLRLSTPHIHISLSSDTIRAMASEGNDEEYLRSNGQCWVTVKWLASDEEPIRVDRGQTNIVSLDGAGLYLEKTSSHGAVYSPTELYLVRKVDIVAIKFAYQPESALL
ncbi:MAG: hypothetical protein M1816_003103 [Peltula sp. TS41687]|nr:MAG: hypothetical protein M1816_003103 [Peltula sp. TS41687]